MRTDRGQEETGRGEGEERGGDEGDVRGKLEGLTPATFVKQIKRCRGSSPVCAHTHKHTHELPAWHTYGSPGPNKEICIHYHN